MPQRSNAGVAAGSRGARLAVQEPNEQRILAAVVGTFPARRLHARPAAEGRHVQPRVFGQRQQPARAPICLDLEDRVLCKGRARLVDVEPNPELAQRNQLQRQIAQQPPPLPQLARRGRSNQQPRPRHVRLTLQFRPLATVAAISRPARSPDVAHCGRSDPRNASASPRPPGLASPSPGFPRASQAASEAMRTGRAGAGPLTVQFLLRWSPMSSRLASPRCRGTGTPTTSRPSTVRRTRRAPPAAAARRTGLSLWLTISALAAAARVARGSRRPAWRCCCRSSFETRRRRPFPGAGPAWRRWPWPKRSSTSCRRCTPIKWPNDVLLNDRKVAGVLAETTWDGEQLVAIVGVGINVRTDPADLAAVGAPATSLKLASQQDVDRGRLLRAFVERLDAGLERSAPARHAAWEARLWGRGQRLHLSDLGIDEDVIVLGADPDGSLRVRRRDGTERRTTTGELIL